METLYQLLGVSADSEDIIIRAAYDALIQKYHPDTFQGAKLIAQSKTKAINEAYEILRNPVKRAGYDTTIGVQHFHGGPGSTRQVPPAAGKKFLASSSGNNIHSGLSNAPVKESHNKKIAMFGLIAILSILAFSAISNSSAIKNLFKTNPSQAVSAYPQHNITAKTGTAAPATETPSTELQIPAKIDWNAKDSGDPKRFVIGGMAFVLSASNGTDPHFPLPTIDADLAGLPHLHFTGQIGSEAAAARVQALKLTARDKYPTLIFMTFSGGAHCCTQIDFFSPANGEWKHASTGGDGEPLSDLPVDINGDGRVDLELKDDRFDYTFDSYAGSDSPPMFFNLINGALVDVSTDPSFASRYKQAMIEDQADCLLHLNGGCAAFVAAAARLGLFDWALQYAIANYDQNSGWSYPKKCDVDTNNLPCPADHQVASTFPEALRQFLAESSYDVPQAHNALAETMPSFECGRVSGAVLQLVCTTPNLAAADRTLAAAYFAVGHLNGAPFDLKSDQIAWIRLRNNSSSDAFTIQRLYDQRISYLTDLARSLSRSANTGR